MALKLCSLAVLAGVGQALVHVSGPRKCAKSALRTPKADVEVAQAKAFAFDEEWRVAALGFGIATASVATPAFAKGGEYGLAEGRIISLAHPVAMGVCFVATLASAYTGYSWRRLREVGADVQEAKKATAAAEAVLAAVAPEADSTRQAAAVAELQLSLDGISASRKSLADGNFKDNHYLLGTVLLAIGIPFAIEGPVNTYMRAGKLFPGDHVYAAAQSSRADHFRYATPGLESRAFVGARRRRCAAKQSRRRLWAIAAALVPHMQKGKEWARTGHIGLNGISVLAFAYYSIPTGLGIAEKVLANTKFP
eukprot:CAMPEP_0184230450 /NCGR_PEP_ID=MMETSP0976-20121227/22778_1 /TAXON_ID=483370 /ORGANISM="non described non described, Strain CCMP2097" /LENGTH=308 /DNA_ID=CAMNT_0026535439 /DNA_START=24 /DNA_END=951 /DNA_ORIENTATION=+